MLDILALTEELQLDEGFSAIPYKDSLGVWTAGHGWNMEARPISRAAAEFILREHILEAVADAERYEWYHTLTDARQRVIVNMLFNLGATRFRSFEKTIGFLERGDFQSAAAEMLDSVWARQVGHRASRLSAMMSTG